MFPLKDIENVHIFDDCFAVGASLGHPPVASNGMITYMDDEIDHFKYWMSSAPTIFGNSGGAVYRWSGNRKIYVHQKLQVGDQVKHQQHTLHQRYEHSLYHQVETY